MSYEKKASLLIGSHRSQTIYGDKSDGEAVQSAIDTVFSTSPDWARADLYSRLMEQWANYPAGTQRRIFVRNTVREWSYWYARTPAPQAKKEKK